MVDEELLAGGESGILDSLCNDPRIPGVRILLVVPQSKKGRKKERPTNELIVNVIKKPFGLRQIAHAINSYPVDSLPAEDSNL